MKHPEPVVNLGNIETNEGEKLKSESSFLNDASRLILLILMVFGFFAGIFIIDKAEQPMKIIGRSITKKQNRKFRASIEGTVSIGGLVNDTIKSHQQYSAETGIVIQTGTKLPEYDAVFDANSALDALHYVSFINEHKKEDMYGHGTRHYSGSIKLPDDDESTMHTFEYWLDMRNLLPVRLILTTVESNLGINKLGLPISRVTFMNIRYYNWRQ